MSYSGRHRCRRRRRCCRPAGGNAIDHLVNSALKLRSNWALNIPVMEVMVRKRQNLAGSDFST